MQAARLGAMREQREIKDAQRAKIDAQHKLKQEEEEEEEKRQEKIR